MFYEILNIMIVKINGSGLALINLKVKRIFYFLFQKRVFENNSMLLFTMSYVRN